MSTTTPSARAELARLRACVATLALLGDTAPLEALPPLPDTGLRHALETLASRLQHTERAHRARALADELSRVVDALDRRRAL